LKQARDVAAMVPTGFLGLGGRREVNRSTTLGGLIVWYHVYDNDRYQRHSGDTRTLIDVRGTCCLACRETTRYRCDECW